MSIFKEWIDTAKQIRDGVANNLGGDSPEKKAMISERLKHCVGSMEEGIATCEHFEQGNLNVLVDGALDFVRKVKGLPENELKAFNGKRCKVCGCGFNLYLVSPEKKCPENKW